MSSSTGSNPHNEQQESNVSLDRLMSAMNSGSTLAKLKARIITTDKLMQLVNKKVKECEALEQHVNTLKEDLEREKKLREEKEDKFNEERLEMQIDNDMLKADLEEKDEEIAQLRARVSSAAVTAPPSPTPIPAAPLIPAPPSQPSQVVQGNNQVLQEIEHLKKGMITLQTQFAQHIKQCSPPVTQSISHSISSTAIIPSSPSSSSISMATSKQPDMTITDIINKSQQKVLAPAAASSKTKTGKQASGLKPSSLRRTSTTSNTPKRKDNPPVSQLQPSPSPSSVTTTPRKETHEADKQSSGLKPSSLRPRPSTACITTKRKENTPVSPPQHSPSPSSVVSSPRMEMNEAGNQTLNGLIVPKPNMNRPNNVRGHVVYEREIRKGAKVLSKKGFPSASTKKNTPLTPSSKRKTLESEHEQGPVRRPLRVVEPEQRRCSQSNSASSSTGTTPSSSTTTPKPSTAPVKPPPPQKVSPNSAIVDKIVTEEPDWVMNHLEDIQKKHFPIHTKKGTKRFFAQIETFYEKLQSFSAVNLKNARVIPYGPPGGVTLTCPTVIHHKEQKMAWFIYVFGKKNASNNLIPKCIKWASNLAAQAVKAKKLSQACRYARLITLLCKNTDRMQPVQVFCYNILRSVPWQEPTTQCYPWIILNVAVIWREALVFTASQSQGGADLIMRSIQTATMELCKRNQKWLIEVYNPLVNVCDWPLPADSPSGLGRLKELVALISQPEIQQLATMNQKMHDTLLFNVQKAFELSMCSQHVKAQHQFVQDVLWPKVIEEAVVDSVINLITSAAAIEIQEKPTKGRRRTSNTSEEVKEMMKMREETITRYRTFLLAKSFTSYDIKLQTAVSKGLLRLSCSDKNDRARVVDWSNTVKAHFLNKQQS
ncbi:hypothetical protein K492DRAFT_173014, partial [Lichtheimia hyalospora FSU 10163]